MRLKRFSSTLVSFSLLSAGSIGMNAVTMFSPVTPSAQAQAAGQSVNTLVGCFINSPFTAKTAFNPTNIRQSPSTSALIVGKLTQVGQSISVPSITTGSTVPDAWNGKPDNMWYRLADGRGFVASAVMNGYPPKCNTPQPQPQPTGSTLGIAVNWNIVAYRSANPFYPTYAPPAVGGKVGSAGNCTWYANGRLRELGRSSSDLNKLTGNAKDWVWQAKNASIPTGNSPRVGAVAQWVSGGGGYGHVAVVEQVNSNGTIVISESSYSTNPAFAFLYKTRTINANSVENYIYVR